MTGAHARPNRRPRTGRQAAVLVVALLAFHPSGGDAQVGWPGSPRPTPSAPQPPSVDRGWIGVGVELTVAEGGRGPTILEVRVVRTVDGGPAAVAGVVLGDVIRAINGEIITIERWQSFAQNLRSGVELSLALDRAGRSREVRLTTAPRPSLPPAPMALTVHLDSVRRSFRTQFESNRGVWNTDAALPFEYLMLQSPEADSVKTAIIGLRGALTQVTEATRTREREIGAIVELRAREFGDSDALLLRLRSDNERVQEELERLAVRLAEIGSNERETRTRAAGFGAGTAVRIPPVTAHIAGQNFVGGAQFNDLNSQLGAYFGTDQGVLVIQVLSGTPCDEAGLVPGDVVTHVGDTEIDSVENFRAVLNGVFARGRRADLTLMRRGQRVSATLSR